MGDQILNQINGYTYQMGDVIVSAINDNQYLVQGLSSGSGKYIKESYTQNNTFTEFSPVYHDGLIWQKAISNSESTTGFGVAITVTGASFDILQSGFHTYTAHGLGNPGEFLYVSQADSGAWSITNGHYN